MQKKQAKLPKKKLIFVLVGVCLATAAALFWVVSNEIAINQDRARFVNAEHEKTLIVEKLLGSLNGNALSTRDQNECFNTEQGPYDNGRLWCQVATVIKLNSSISFSNIGERYKVAAADLPGTPFYSSGAGLTERFWIVVPRGIPCNLSEISDQGKSYGGPTSNPFTNKDRPAIAITCADRARAAYYTYVQ